MAAFASWDSDVSVTAYVGLGSNLGDREASLRNAIERLHLTEGVCVTGSVEPIETAPVGPSNETYLNTAVELNTMLSARELLRACQMIEEALGRTRTPGKRWEARSIDIDILLYGNDIVDDDDLVIPHPQMDKRYFVLEPMSRLAPNARHPRFDRTVVELLEALEGD